MEEEPPQNDNGRMSRAPGIAGGHRMSDGAGTQTATDAAQEGRLPSPGEIAGSQDRQQGQQQGQGHSHNQDRGRGM
jgi:hypothetical protein